MLLEKNCHIEYILSIMYMIFFIFNIFCYYCVLATIKSSVLFWWTITILHAHRAEGSFTCACACAHIRECHLWRTESTVPAHLHHNESLMIVLASDWWDLERTGRTKTRGAMTSPAFTSSVWVYLGSIMTSTNLNSGRQMPFLMAPSPFYQGGVRFFFFWILSFRIKVP